MCLKVAALTDTKGTKLIQWCIHHHSNTVFATSLNLSAETWQRDNIYIQNLDSKLIIR
jgi:hypothetical protein